MDTVLNMITYEDKPQEPIEIKNKNEELNNNNNKSDEEKEKKEEEDKEKEKDLNDIYKFNELDDIINSNYKNNDLLENNKESNENNIDYNNMNFDLNNNNDSNNINNINKDENKIENGIENEKENNVNNISDNKINISNNSQNNKEEENKDIKIDEINYINEDINNNIKDSNKNDNLNNNINEDIKKNINTEIKDNNINKDINNNIKEDMNNNIKEDINNNINEDINNNIKDDNIYNINNINNNIYNNNNNNIKEHEININNENMNINKEHIIDNNKDNKVSNKDNKKENNIQEKDIIDELIEKIKSNEIISNKEANKEALNKLDEEIKLGLEKLKEIDTSNKLLLDSNDEKISNNRKFKSLLYEINKSINETKNKTFYKMGTYIDYKNFKILKPREYFQTEKKPIKRFIRYKKDGIYLSSIDGKVIVNGERKDVGNSINFNNNCEDNNMLMKSWNNFSQIKNWGINNQNNNNCGFEYDLSKSYGGGRKSYSHRNKRREIDIGSIPQYRVRKINKYNKDYFKEELNKINNLLFSNNNYRINNKF